MISNRLMHRGIAPLLAWLLYTPPADAQLKFAELGDCPTVAGDVVRGCRVAYRTYGALNAARDNAVLIPSWYGGTSTSLQRLIREPAMVDTTQFFVVLVDALGDGVSTSPSNSTLQPRAAFPRLTITDMVHAEHRLVKEHLKLARLHAVVGFSMGAFQALEWGVRYPDDVGAIVSLHGGPRPAAHDVYTYRVLRWLVRLAQQGGLPPDSASVPLVDMWNVIRATPARINETPVAAIDTLVLRTAQSWKAFDHDDHRVQLEAILAHDIASAFDGDLARAAAAIRARLLLVVSPDDHIVGPDPAVELARLATRAELLSVPSACGHFALYCEPEIAARVRSFLAPRQVQDGSRDRTGR